MKHLRLTTQEWVALTERTCISLAHGLAGIVLSIVTGIVSVTAWLCRLADKAMTRYPKVVCGGVTIIFAAILLVTYAQMKVTTTSLTYQRDSLQIQIDSVKARGGFVSYPQIRR